MKKIITIVLSLVFTLALLTACGDPQNQGPYKVTFDLQGGTGTAPVQMVENGEKAIRPAVDPVYGEKYFKGWSSAAGTFTEFDFDTAITKDTTIYAFWTDDAPEIFEVADSAYKWSCFMDITEEWLAEGYYALKLFEGGTGELIKGTDITPVYYEYNPLTKIIWIHSEEEPGGGYDVNETGILDGDTLTLGMGDDGEMILIMRLAEDSLDTYEIISATMYSGFDFILDFKTDGSVKMDFMFMGEIIQTVTGEYTVEGNSVIIEVTDLNGDDNIIHFIISNNSTLLTVDFSKGELPLLYWMEDYLDIEVTSLVFTKTV